MLPFAMRMKRSRKRSHPKMEGDQTFRLYVVVSCKRTLLMFLDLGRRPR